MGFVVSEVGVGDIEVLVERAKALLEVAFHKFFIYISIATQTYEQFDSCGREHAKPCPFWFGEPPADDIPVLNVLGIEDVNCGDSQGTPTEYVVEPLELCHGRPRIKDAIDSVVRIKLYRKRRVLLGRTCLIAQYLRECHEFFENGEGFIDTAFVDGKLDATRLELGEGAERTKFR